MSYTVQAAEPNASATVRGVVTPGAQTFAGPKTFANKVTVSPQAGGIALEVDGPDEIRWTGVGGITTLGSMMHSPGLGWRTQSAAGFWMGGINSAFTSSGISAASQGYSADVYQGQDTMSLALFSAKGAAAGVVVKMGTGNATPHAGAELLRVGYALGPTGGSDGTAVYRVFANGICEIVPAGGGFKANAGAATYVLMNGSTWGIWTNSGDLSMHFTAGNITMLSLNAAAGKIYASTYPFYADIALGTNKGDTSAAPGNAVSNFSGGRSAIANGAAAVTITTDKLTAGDQVLITWEGNHGAARDWVTYGVGTFTVNLNANATANTTFNWFILKKGN